MSKNDKILLVVGTVVAVAIEAGISKYMYNRKMKAKDAAIDQRKAEEFERIKTIAARVQERFASGQYNANTSSATIFADFAFELDQ